MGTRAGEARETALAEFHEQWKDEGLVMLKWLALQVRPASGFQSQG